MQTVVRFAPSPTGLLHVGNARVALINRLFAYNGNFILRFDDTDKSRSCSNYVTAIENDLSWLGIRWEAEIKQSERSELYDTIMAKLKLAGRVYPCYETTEELEKQRREQLAQGKPPLYKRAALKLSIIERTQLEASGRKPYWRFLLNSYNVQWQDLVHGKCHYHSTYLSDPIIQRADGTYLYMLPSVIDDIELSVTHVIRGDDHITNTAVQIQLFQALLASVPSFAHLPLMSGIEGEELSKRLGILSLHSLRKSGIEPMALASLLVTTGTARPICLRHSLEELAEEFTIKQYSRATPRFDISKLWRMNTRLLQAVSFFSVQKRLTLLGLTKITEEFWNAVRPNLNSVGDVDVWWHICTALSLPLVTPPIRYNVIFYSLAIRLLPPEPWNGLTWALWTNAIEISVGCSRKSLLQLLRLALTRRNYGPELKLLLPTIGRSRVTARLRDHITEIAYNNINSMENKIF